MSAFYGTKSKLVSSSDIFAISTGAIQVTRSGDSNVGGFFIEFYPTGGGCGTPNDMAIFLKLKDTYPNWSKLTYKIDYVGSTACWGFNSAGTRYGIDLAGNMLPFNISSGDMYYRALDCFEKYPFNTASGMVDGRCDNSSANAFHSNFNSAPHKEFYTVRRRNSMSSPAGPAMQLSCNSTGGSIIISNIFIQ